MSSAQSSFQVCKNFLALAIVFSSFFVGAESMEAGQGLLARLVRNHDTTGGLPPYALADQSGRIQRYVEPTPGIDLESSLNQVVVVRHDTGNTLLASQLELPEKSPLLPLLPSTSQKGVQQAQYFGPAGSQGVVMPRGVVPLDSMPRGAGGAPVWVQSPGMPPGMSPGMQGMPGTAPIYLDGPMPGSMAPGNMGVPCGNCPQCAQGYYGQCAPTQPVTRQPAACPVPQGPSPCEPRISVFAEALYLHPTGVDMVHAQQQNGIGGAGTVPFGQIGAVDPKYDLGYRAGVNIPLDRRSSLAVSYTFFESDAQQSVGPPTIPGGGGAVGSLVHHPGAVITASVGPVNAAYGIDFQYGDLEFRSLLHACNSYCINYSVGARYAQLDQDFFQTGVFAGGAAGVLQTRTNIDFDGVGLKLGLDGEHLLGRRGWSIYGRTSLSPMSGNFGSRYTMTNASVGVLLADAAWSDDRFVTLFDYETGFAWTDPSRQWRLSLGYTAAFWFNMITTPEFVDAVQADNYVDVGDTISFDGGVARVEYLW